LLEFPIPLSTFIARSNTRLSDTYANEMLSGLIRCAEGLHLMDEPLVVVVIRHDDGEPGIVKEVFGRGSVRVR
jgi:hypothetical protein